MARISEITAIILERQPLKEYDRRVIVYSREFGKLECVAKGTLKIESKLAGSLEPLTEVRLNLSRGHTDRVIGSVIRQTWPRLHSDLQILAAASFAAQVTVQLTRPDSPDSDLYQALFGCLATLDQGTERSPGLVVRQFLWTLLDQLGFKPRIDQCAKCGKPLDDGMRYSGLHGGALCSACAQSETATLPFTQEMRCALENLGKTNEPALKTSVDRAVARIIDQTLLNHIGERLPAERFWQSINALHG